MGAAIAIGSRAISMTLDAGSPGAASARGSAGLYNVRRAPVTAAPLLELSDRALNLTGGAVRVWGSAPLPARPAAQAPSSMRPPSGVTAPSRPTPVSASA